MEVDKYHRHLLVNADPSISATQIIRRVKQNTTSSVWKEFHNYKKIIFGKRRLIGQTDILFHR